MVTKIVESTTPNMEALLLMRNTPLKYWFDIPELNDRLSGTLKKGARIGFRSHELLKHEAVAQTLGWGFEMMPSSYVVFGDAISEGDNKAITEVGWHVDRLMFLNPFKEDVYELKYITIQDAYGNNERIGVGVILKETSISWIPKANIVFALLTEYDIKTDTWTECLNPF